MFRSKDIFSQTCNTTDVAHDLTPDELKGLQSHLLKMYKDLEAVCVRHDLQIAVAFGNVLGAIRHNGWIPWDDDLDVTMPRKDYDLLLSKYIHELPDNYIVYSSHTKQGPIYRFAKVIDKNTVFRQIEDGDNCKHYQGVFIDIFPLDNCPTGKWNRKWRKLFLMYLMFTATSVMYFENSNKLYKQILTSTPKGKVNYYLRQTWGAVHSLFNSKQWYRWIDKFTDYKKDTGYVHDSRSSELCYKPCEKSMMFPTKDYTFADGTVVKIPNEPVQYLELIYGDWQKLPPKDKIWRHYLKAFALPGK